jgi:hypothetical protein
VGLIQGRTGGAEPDRGGGFLLTAGRLARPKGGDGTADAAGEGFVISRIEWEPEGEAAGGCLSKIKVAPLSEILVEAMASGGSVTVWNKSIWNLRGGLRWRVRFSGETSF